MATTTKLTDRRCGTAKLVVAAQAGDRQAFGELFRRFERHVFAVALRQLGNVDGAEELCQDVFVQALQKIGQLRDPACFGGWLRSITRRMAINRAARRAPLAGAHPEVLESACVESLTPLAQALSGERALHVRASLARLRELDRQTLEAFYVDGLSLAQMSNEFDAPLGTIKRRLHVARKRLAKQVDGRLAV